MNYKIIIKNSSIVINDYDIGDAPRLESLFQVYNNLTHSYNILGMHYNEEKRQLFLPRGIDIPYIERVFKCDAYVDTNYDKAGRLDNCVINYGPRDDEQIEALKFMNGVNEWRRNSRKSQLSLNLKTGKGKTYCSIATAQLFQYRTIIITSSTDWLRQWKESIMDYTNTKESEIYDLVGSPRVHMMLQRDPSKYKYILASHQTLSSYANKYGWDKITELFKHMQVGLKFYDESHLMFENICMIDFYTNTYKTYYVTATPAKSSESEDAIYKYYFKNIPSIDLFDARKDRHTHYISISYNSHPNAEEIEFCSNVYGFDKNKYSSYILYKENFYKLMKILLQKVINNNGKNIMYFATNNSILKIYEWITNHYPELNNNVGIYTSIVNKEVKKEQLNKKLILSTTSSLGAAVDIKGLKMVICVAEPFKSRVTAEQSFGRTRDFDTLYIEIIDRGFKRIRDFKSYKEPVYKKLALSISNLTLTDSELDRRARQIDMDRNPQGKTPAFTFFNIAVEKKIEVDGKPCGYSMIEYI